MSELPTSSVSSSHYCSRISSTNMEFCSESISFIGMKEKKKNFIGMKERRNPQSPRSPSTFQNRVSSQMAKLPRV
jgi:hypothetical protein